MWAFLIKTIIPLALVGYEMIIANSYPTRTRGIIVNYQMINDIKFFFIRKQLSFYYTHNICIFAYAKEFEPNQRSEQYFSQVEKICQLE